MSNEKPIWPNTCDICIRPLFTIYVDGATRNGSWANMCPSCRIDEKRFKLGTGLGQKYMRLNRSQPWTKVEG
jgi:hypothetical protein